jgi:hypothetical protein
VRESSRDKGWSTFVLSGQREVHARSAPLTGAEASRRTSGRARTPLRPPFSRSGQRFWVDGRHSPFGTLATFFTAGRRDCKGYRGREVGEWPSRVPSSHFKRWSSGSGRMSALCLLVSRWRTLLSVRGATLRRRLAARCLGVAPRLGAGLGFGILLALLGGPKIERCNSFHAAGRSRAFVT